MFKQSYETTAGSLHLPQKLQSSLLLGTIEGSLENPLFSQTPDMIGVVQKNANTNVIPVFHQPFMTTQDSRNLTFVDLRPYTSSLRRDHTGSIIFPKEGALGILVRRALLETEWSLAGTRRFVVSIQVPMVVFSNWISGLLASKLTLPEDVALKVQALAAYYYYLLHYTEEQFTPNLKEIIALKVSRALGIEFSRLQAWYSELPYTANLDDFAAILASQGGSMSLNKMTRQVLWAITSTSWFGSNDVKDLLAISLEYPPAFISLIYAGMTESLYRKAFLSNLIDRLKRRKLDLNAFIDQVNGILRDQFTYEK